MIRPSSSNAVVLRELRGGLHPDRAKTRSEYSSPGNGGGNASSAAVQLAKSTEKGTKPKQSQPKVGTKVLEPNASPPVRRRNAVALLNATEHDRQRQQTKADLVTALQAACGNATTRSQLVAKKIPHVAEERLLKTYGVKVLSDGEGTIIAFIAANGASVCMSHDEFMATIIPAVTDEDNTDGMTFRSTSSSGKQLPPDAENAHRDPASINPQSPPGFIAHSPGGNMPLPAAQLAKSPTPSVQAEVQHSPETRRENVTKPMDTTEDGGHAGGSNGGEQRPFSEELQELDDDPDADGEDDLDLLPPAVQAHFDAGELDRAFVNMFPGIAPPEPEPELESDDDDDDARMEDPRSSKGKGTIKDKTDRSENTSKPKKGSRYTVVTPELRESEGYGEEMLRFSAVDASGRQRLYLSGVKKSTPKGSIDLVMNARRKNGYKGFKRQAPGTKKHESMTRTTFNALASKAYELTRLVDGYTIVMHITGDDKMTVRSFMSHSLEVIAPDLRGKVEKLLWETIGSNRNAAVRALVEKQQQDYATLQAQFKQSQALNKQLMTEKGERTELDRRKRDAKKAKKLRKAKDNVSRPKQANKSLAAE